MSRYEKKTIKSFLNFVMGWTFMSFKTLSILGVGGKLALWKSFVSRTHDDISGWGGLPLVG